MNLEFLGIESDDAGMNWLLTKWPIVIVWSFNLPNCGGCSSSGTEIISKKGSAAQQYPI